MNVSHEAHAERINVLTGAIKRAQNDSQRFAALLAVSKMLKADELSEDERKKIFLAIGFSFPLRLMTSVGGDDCPKAILNDLGISILSSFVSDPELAQAPEHRKIIPSVLKLVEELCEDLEPTETTLRDCFSYLVAITEVDYNCLTVLKHSAIKRLVHVFCCDVGDEIRTMFWIILQNLINFHADTVWCDNKEQILVLLEFVAHQASTDFSEKKFELFDRLSCLFSSHSPENAEFYCDKKWMSDLKKSLFEVLCSRISAKQRNPTLRLCHHLTEVFGFNWTLFDESKDAKSFAVLLVKLSCVEIHMIIHNWLNKTDSLSQILHSDDMSTFVVCCALCEAACSAIASYDTDDCNQVTFEYKDIDDLQGSLANAAEGIGASLLPEIMKLPELKDIVLSCLRTIGAWLNVHLFATSKLGLSIVQIIFSAFQYCAQFEPTVAVRSATPAFLHYAENENARNQLLDLHIVSSLTATVLERELADDDKYLCSQCLMAFCVQSQNSDEFDSVLPSFMDYSLKLELNDALCFYVSLLGLMVWNKRCNVSRPQPQSERFFQHMIRLLYNVHSITGNIVRVSKR